jgi:hypothetical protein
VPSSQPNYLTVDPTTGAVGAVFPGGVVIPSVSDPTPHTGPQIARTVRWMRGSDGALVADIYGYARGGATRSGIQIHAPLVSGYTTAGIIAQVGNVPPATILDSDGTSVFVQTDSGKLFLRGPYNYTVSSTGGTVNTHPLPTVPTGLVGILISQINPFGHWLFRYYARPTIPDIVTVNDGVTQNVGLGYCTLSTA